MTVVVADLGATNARFAIIKKGKMSDVYQFACDDFKDPAQMITSFMTGYASEAKYLLCGVPGPVVNNAIQWTNRPWKINAKKLKSALKLKEVVLMNDLQVQGAAISTLKPQDLVYLQKPKTAKGPKILVNVGTGLGACYLINGEVYGAEYGQTIMPEGYPLEARVSGSGFKKLHTMLTNGKGPISAIEIEREYFNNNRMAKKTYEVFFQELALALMNMALTIKATGGVYFCGGVLNEKILKTVKFKESFYNHKKMKALLKTMPLIFIKKKDFAFLGLKMLVKKFGWS